MGNNYLPLTRTTKKNFGAIIDENKVEVKISLQQISMSLYQEGEKWEKPIPDHWLELQWEKPLCNKVF